MHYEKLIKNEESIQEAEERMFYEANFTSPMNEYQLMEFGIPNKYSGCTKKDVLPDHEDYLRNYVRLFTVGEGKKNAPYGLIMNGDDDLCMTYMSIILQRVHIRKRTIHCGSAFDLEMECRDLDNLSYFSKVNLLGVYDFPFFINGNENKPHLLMTNFHQMLCKRYRNCFPTLFYTSVKSFSVLLQQYMAFPAHMMTALEAFNKLVTFEKG